MGLIKKETESVRLYFSAAVIRLLVFAALVFPALSPWQARFQPGSYAGYDDDGYYRISEALVEEGQFIEFIGGKRVSIYRTPGYTAFLAALGLMTRFNPVWMTVLQILLLSLIPVLFKNILERLGLRSGMAWAMVFDPLTILMSISLMTEGLLTLLLLLAFRGWLGADRVLSRYGAMLALSIATLIKPTVLYLVPILLLDLLWRRSKRVHTVAALGVASVLVLGWMARNYQVAGLFTMSTQSDNQILAVESVRALQGGVPAADVTHYVLAKLEEDLDARPYDLITDNAFHFSGALVDYALENPLTVIWFQVHGAFRLLLGTGRNHVRSVFLQEKSNRDFRYYDLFMITVYGLLYLAAVATFRPFRFLKTDWMLACGGIVLYHLALMSLFSWTTGGALKRAPFIPFVYLIVAGQIDALLRQRIHSAVKASQE